MISTATAHAYHLTATNAVWIALANLHSEHPEKEGFTTSEIEDQVRSLSLFQKDPRTVSQHITQHLAALKPCHAKPRRMVTELADGRRRLFVEGDDSHSSRFNSPIHPAPEDLPAEFRSLLHWYGDWSRQVRQRRANSTSKDPLEALEGTWSFGEADSYLHEMRDGWEGRS